MKFKLLALMWVYMWEIHSRESPQLYKTDGISEGLHLHNCDIRDKIAFIPNVKRRVQKPNQNLGPRIEVTQPINKLLTHFHGNYAKSQRQTVSILILTQTGRKQIADGGGKKLIGHAHHIMLL